MKKILIIQDSLGGGGAEKVLCGVLNEFDYSKYDVTLLLWHKTGVYLERIPSEVRIIGISEQKHCVAEKILFKVPMGVGNYVIGRLLKNTEVANERYDVMISFLEGIAARIHEMLQSRAEKNISWVHTDVEHNRWSDKYFPYHRAERFYSGINDVVFVSNGAKVAFERVFRTQSRHHVVYNLQQPDEIRRLGAEPVEGGMIGNRFTICCVGRLVRQKRFDRVISIASKLKQKGYDVLFRIIGDGNLKEEMMVLAHDFGVDDRIEFTGFQSNPYKYMKSADIFLLTSESEGFSLVVAEALILGKAVISTNVTGPMELLGDGAGMVCEENEDSLADAIIRLHDDVVLRGYYECRALEYSKRFNPVVTMKEIYSVIEN